MGSALCRWLATAENAVADSNWQAHANSHKTCNVAVRPPHSREASEESFEDQNRENFEKTGRFGAVTELAERVGFEPTVEFPLHTLSKRAPSTTRTSLRVFRISSLQASG